MEAINQVDFNDLMFEINDPQAHQQEEIGPIGNDSNLGSSLSNFGVDIDNPLENLRYIQQNQDQRAIIQGIGVAARVDANSEATDSALATSISKTINSEFIPEVIEYQRETSQTNSEINETIEAYPGPSNGERQGYDPKYDESEKLAESLEEMHMSAFDLALGKGYYDQAKIYFDDATSKGLQIKTKHVKKIKIPKREEDTKEEIEGDLSDLESEEDFIDKEYGFQQFFMLKKDFKEYLENLEKNEHKKVLKRLNYKKRLNKPEKQIKKNVKTKENRKKLKDETIKLVKNYIVRLENIEKGFQQMLEKIKEEQAENNKAIPKGCEIFPNQNEGACKPHEEDGKPSK